MKEGELLGRSYSNGEIIFREGEKGEAMYVIQAGKVKITKSTASGDVTIATLESGDIFGEMSLFDRLPRSATATAYGDARILSIDKKKLFASIDKDPTLVFKILETMSKRIRRLNEDFTALKKNRSGILKISFSVEDTCNMILEEARNLIKADNGSVMLLADDEKSLSIKAAFGTEADSKLKFAVGDGIAGDVIRIGRAELVNNVTMDSRFKSGEIHIKSLICVPLKCAGINLGVINMSNCSERLFTIDDLKLLHSLSMYAAMAIQNAKNFSSLRDAMDKVLMHATILDVW